MEVITHNNLPEAIHLLLTQTLENNKLITQILSRPTKDEAMSLDKVVEIDPLNRAKSTFYSYTQNPSSGFPFRKRGKHIVVLRSEFDEWLALGKNQNVQAIQRETDNLLSKQ